MKLLSALALFLVLLFFGACFLVQAILLLAFSIAGKDTKARPPAWIRQGLIPLAVLILVVGIITSPVLFYFDAVWVDIAIPAAVGFGGSGVLIAIAVMSLAK